MPPPGDADVSVLARERVVLARLGLGVEEHLEQALVPSRLLKGDLSSELIGNSDGWYQKKARERTYFIPIEPATVQTKSPALSYSSPDPVRWAGPGEEPFESALGRFIAPERGLELGGG